MLRHEFRDAIRTVAPKIPERWIAALTAGSTWDAVTIAYGSHRLDALLSGNDRHVRFAEWLLSHQPAFFRLSSRVARRERERQWKAYIAALWQVRDKFINGKAGIPTFELYR